MGTRSDDDAKSEIAPITVRYWAAARAAAGTETDDLGQPGASVPSDHLGAELGEGHGAGDGHLLLRDAGGRAGGCPVPHPDDLRLTHVENPSPLPAYFGIVPHQKTGRCPALRFGLDSVSPETGGCR